MGKASVDERRREIVRRAAKVFREKGYHGATMEDLAAEMNFTKGNFYYYIRSKEDLLCEMYDQAADMFLGAITPIALGDFPPREKLERIIKEHIGLVAREKELFGVFFQEKSALPAAKRETMLQAQRRYQEMVEAVIGEGQQAGAFAPVDPRLAAFAILGAGNWAYQWFRPDGPLTAEEVGEVFSHLLLDGLGR